MSEQEKKQVAEEVERKLEKVKEEIKSVEKSQAKFGVVKEFAGGLIYNLSANTSFAKRKLIP